MRQRQCLPVVSPLSLRVFGGAVLPLLLLTGCSGEPMVADLVQSPGEMEIASSRKDELQGGRIVSSTDVLRSAVVNLFSSLGNCTGTVIRTSAMDNRTWIITAAHCVCGAAQGLTISRPGGGQIIGQAGTGQYTFNSGNTCPSVSGTDIAVVRFPFSVGVTLASGTVLREYSRPVLGLDGPSNRFAVFGRGNNSGAFPNLFCSFATGTSDGSLRWADSSYSSSNGSISNAVELAPAGSGLAPGDSGGPWIVTSAPPVQVEPIPDYLNRILDNGVVAGVTSGSVCVLGGVTWVAAPTFNPSNLSFLASTMGPDLTTVNDVNWVRSCFSDWACYSSSQRASLIDSFPAL